MAGCRQQAPWQAAVGKPHSSDVLSVGVYADQAVTCRAGLLSKVEASLPSPRPPLSTSSMSTSGPATPPGRGGPRQVTAADSEP
jgi:hypothetical protein